MAIEPIECVDLVLADRVVVGKWLKSVAQVALSKHEPVVISPELAVHVAVLLLHPPGVQRSQSPTSQVVGGEGGYALQRHRNTKRRTTSKSQPGTAEQREASTPRITWLSGYIGAYQLGYREAPSPMAIRRMGRAFKELEVAMPREELVTRFARYCTHTPLKYYSVEHFGETLPNWREGGYAQEMAKQDKDAPRPGESTDAYLTRLTSGAR